MRPRYRLAVFSLATVILAGCVMSKNPLSRPDDAVADESLCGVWDKSTDANSVNQIVISMPTAGKLPKGMMMFRELNGDRKTLNVNEPVLFFISKIGNDEYWNLIANPTLVEKDPPANYLEKFDFDRWVRDPKHIYLFVRCQRQKDRFTLQMLDPDAMVKVIQAGKLKGVIERDPKTNEIKSVSLSDSTENVRAFLKSTDKEIFKDDSTEEYRKVR